MDDEFFDNPKAGYTPWRMDYVNYPDGKGDLYQQVKKAPVRDYGTGRQTLTEMYHSREFADLEWERMWKKTWLIVGHINDVPRENSFMKVDLGKESFLIVRGKGDELRGMYNVCQHRGTRLVTQDFGSAKKFVCPFHMWEFSNSGKLTHVAKKETFRRSALCHDLDLPKIRVETWRGWIFMNMDRDAEPLLDWIPQDFRDLFEAYDMEKMVRVVDKTQEWDINWKAAIEAFIEGYHVEAVHSQMNPYFDSYHNQHDLFDNGFARSIFPFMVPMPTKKAYARTALSEEAKLFMREALVSEDEFPESDAEARQKVLDGKRRNQKKIGMDYSRFTDEQLIDDWNCGLFPACSWNLHPEGVLVQRWWPHPKDPSKMIYYYQVYAMPGIKEMPTYMGVPPGADTSGKKVLPRFYIEKGDLEPLGSVLSQDAIFLPRLQQGIESDGFKGAVYSEQEIRLRQMQDELFKKMKINPEGWTPRR